MPRVDKRERIKKRPDKWWASKYLKEHLLAYRWFFHMWDDR